MLRFKGFTAAPIPIKFGIDILWVLMKDIDVYFHHDKPIP